MKTRRRRWSDHDRNFGPFTFALDKGSRTGFTLDTGDSEYGGAVLRVHAHRCTFVAALPSLLPLGREYGAVLTDGYVHVRYGPQTGDSHTEKSWCWELPWTAWRHVRHSIYGLRGEHIASAPKPARGDGWWETRKACPSVSFEFDDFDGERITAKTHIEEREWLRGRGWFRWLSLVCRRRVHRSLDIAFSKETGERKGSWKGGTIGHSIEMQPGELHESAFRRYCAEHNMTFIKRAGAPS